MISQLIYRSRATRDFWPDDLYALVEKARQKNSPQQLSGMLLFHDGTFVQLLEGSAAAIDKCFATISADSRHTDIQILFRGSVNDRDFPDWTMGFERVTDAWNLPREWATIFEDVAPLKCDGSVSAVKELLLSFRHTLASEENA
jgi:hypothetical protein